MKEKVKWDELTVKDFLLNNGYAFVELKDDVFGRFKNLKVKDNYGFLYLTNIENILKSIKRNNKLSPFFNGNPYTNENLDLYTKTNNNNIIITKYPTHSKDTIEYYCNKCDKINTATYRHFDKEIIQICYDCRILKNKEDRLKDVIAEIYNMYSNIELKVISKIYENNTSKLDMIDKYGYKYSLSLASIKKMHTSKTEFPSIINTNPYASDNIRLFVKLNCSGLEVVGDIKDSKVDIECEYGHRSTISIYHLMDRKRCPKCNKHREITIDTVREEFESVGYELITSIYERNSQIIEFKCPTHGYQTVVYSNFSSLKSGCKECAKEKISKLHTKSNEDFIKEFKEIYANEFEIVSEYNKSLIGVKVKHIECGHVFERLPIVLLRSKNYCPNCQTKGEYTNNWKGGLTPIRQSLRDYCKDIFDVPTFELFDYKCALTSFNKDLNAHHLYSFSSILYEEYEDSFIDNNIDSAFELIKDSIRTSHKNYGLGVVLNKRIHNLFHSQYGVINNTHLQFKQFVKRMQSGEFDEYLNENNLVLNLNYDALNKLALL